jgi:hypothetical protein
MIVSRKKFAACAFLLLFVANIGIAQLEKPKIAPELWKEVKDYGSVRVVVQLNVTSRPEEKLRIGQKATQREAITHAQDRLLTELAGSHHRVILMSRLTPSLVLNVEPEAMAILEASALVRTITRDSKQPSR